MKIENPNLFKRSSFLSVDKDTYLILDKVLQNKRLQKLIYYNTSDALYKPDLTPEQVGELANKYILNVPKIKADPDVRTYLIINFDAFTPNETNTEFRDNNIVFNIICHYDQWRLDDFQLRPYRIAAEIDSMFNEKHLTGIGKLNFLTAVEVVLSNELGGISLAYRAIHGGEDKVNALTPEQEAALFE